MRNAYWLVGMTLTILMAGYIFTVDRMVNHEVAYGIGLFVIGLAVMMACRRTLPMQVENAALWMVILVFLSSYCVKLFLIVVSPESPVVLGMVPRVGLGEFDYPLLIIDVLLLTAAGITAFSVAVLAVPAFVAYPGLVPIPNADRVGRRSLIALLVVALILSLVSGWVSYRFDIGLMGSEIRAILPYRLRGIVFYLRNYFLTGLLLLTVYLAYRRSYRGLAWIAIGLLVLNGVADLAIRSSKASILAPLLYLAFLIIASGVKIRVRHVVLTVAISVPLLILLPYFNTLRTFRLSGQGVWESIASAAVSADFHPVELLLRGFTWVIYRLPGVDILTAILGHHASPVGDQWFEIFSRPNGIAGYLTNDVFLTPVSHPHLAAPGYFGWWYLLLGVPGVVLGGASLGLFVRIAWPLTLKLATHTAVLTRVFVLMLLFTALTEGTVDSMLKMFLAMLFTVLTLEGFIRMAVRFNHR